MVRDDINRHFLPVPPVVGAMNHCVCKFCDTKVDRKSLLRKSKHLAGCQQFQMFQLSQPEPLRTKLLDTSGPSSSSNSNGKRAWEHTSGPPSASNLVNKRMWENPYKPTSTSDAVNRRVLDTSSGIASLGSGRRMWEKTPGSSSAAGLGGKRLWDDMPMSPNDRMKRGAAMVVYTGDHPLTLFDQEFNPEMVDWVKNNFDPSFTGINRRTIAALIPECKEQAQLRAAEVLDGDQWLGLMQRSNNSRPMPGRSQQLDLDEPEAESASP